MLTTNGKTHIKRYLAGQVPAIAQSIAFGIGAKAESATDTYLQFEVGRSDIVLTSFDFVTNKLIFKAPVAEEYAGQILEVALFSTATNPEAGDYGSRLISTFDSDSEEWVNLADGTDEVFLTNTSRIGGDSLSHTPAASSLRTSSLPGLFLDFSGNSGADKFIFSFNVGNTNATNVKFRFLTDSANYYDFTIAANTAGYKIVEALKSTAVATGTPDWSNITEIQVTTTAGSGGAAAVDFDGIRIEDTDSISPNYVMVSRELLSVPFIKTIGMSQDIEFALDVNV